MPVLIANPGHDRAADVPTAPEPAPNGLTPAQIRWIPLAVPLAALTMALAVVAVLSVT